jgi:hypothetical protein
MGPALLALTRRWAFMISAIIVMLTVIIALTVPWLPLPDPNGMEAPPYEPPGAAHWLGTDNYGRDVLARLAWGAQLALVVAIVSSAIASLIGIVLGSISGYTAEPHDRCLPPDPVVLSGVADRRAFWLAAGIHHAGHRADDMAALGPYHESTSPQP